MEGSGFEPDPSPYKTITDLDPDPRLRTLKLKNRIRKHNAFCVILYGTGNVIKICCSKFSNVDKTAVDMCYPPIIQSGGNYKLKFSVVR
jgi:hypothetical protein